MTAEQTAKELFFNQTDLDETRVRAIVSETLDGCEDGELYLEYAQSESFAFDDGRLKKASFDTSRGFGLRGVAGESTGYAHSSDLSEEAIKRAAQTVSAVRRGFSGVMDGPPQQTNQRLYAPANPLDEVEFDRKVNFLAEIDAYVRSKDERVRQVSAALSGEWSVVYILRSDGTPACDIRPLVRLDISVVVGQGDRQESGHMGAGGRGGYTDLLDPNKWREQADEALRQAIVNLSSVAAPAGEMEVVLGPGWPGVMLHEAVGHGLEGDFNCKKTSAFSGLLGERVAAPGVTVVDDGTIEGRRGSLTVDDEGTPSQYTTLIEDGILINYMQDRLNARLMGMEATGNGRRQSYAHMPMPRMTNTYMLNGDRDPEEILKAVKKGIYAVNFGGGQVDITSGKFVFTCTEAYRVENGKVGAPVKGATLIGVGPEVLKRITMIGNDMKLDSGVGTCGKNGQGVPVGVGQPTMLIDRLTVGGTAA